MAQSLLFSVYLHDGRYHGAGESSPSPARLFQALVAGASRGGGVPAEDREALGWLEMLAPPIIAAPSMQRGQRVEMYVPNNDLDAVGGDPARLADIRAKKIVEPKIFDAAVPFLFAWRLPPDGSGELHAMRLCATAERLYQFGRGVDMAWATATLIADDALDEVWRHHRGPIGRPSTGSGGRVLPCPSAGSLQSLEARHAANSRRFVRVAGEKTVLFAQPPKPFFRQVAYDTAPARFLYELQRSDGSSVRWPIQQIARLVEAVRDGAAARLAAAVPERQSEFERVVVGRRPEGAPSVPRLRIVPLPSIGHEHADRYIRRILVEVPSACTIRPADVNWAFSGLVISDPDTGEVLDATLVVATDEAMLRHYGVGPASRASRSWRSVTPAALPETAARRRIEPTRRQADAKGGRERAAENRNAVDGVVQALRHAEIIGGVRSVRVQREPHSARERRAELFAPGTRFVKERLWHVELTLDRTLEGPLVIGDGRFLGLGLMRPTFHPPGVHAFEVDGWCRGQVDAVTVSRAFRRAVMARVHSVLGAEKELPPFFSGHDREGAAARSEIDPHLTFTFDPEKKRLFVLAPHVVERRTMSTRETGHLVTLEDALTDFTDLRAGRAGLLYLRETVVDLAEDRLFAASCRWASATPYVVTRHAKRLTAVEALAADIRTECSRRGLRSPHVSVRSTSGIAGLGLAGIAELTFDVPQPGPIVLGRTHHIGGGLFLRCD